MSKRVTEAASLELAFLAALDIIHADVDVRNRKARID
jgi:hypothetical protein